MRYRCLMAQIHGAPCDLRVERLQSSGGEGTTLLVLSVKAGRPGPIPTADNSLLHLERWWNLAVENPVSGRSLRVGRE